MASIVGLAAPAHAAGHLIQPPGASFAAAFPGNPADDINTVNADRNFPGATGVAYYWVSPDSDADIVGTSTPLPHAPTYVVATATYSTPGAATTASAELARAIHLKPGPVAGLHGHSLVGRESSFVSQKGHITEPKAFESFVDTRKGNLVYVAIAITSRRATAVAFTRSLRITAPGTSALPTGSGTLPGAVPAAAPSTSSSHKFRDGAVIVVGLALIALGLAFKRQGSFSLGHTKAAPAPAADPADAAPLPPTDALVPSAVAAVHSAPVDSAWTEPAPVETEAPMMAMAAGATTSSKTVLPLPPPPPAPPLVPMTPDAVPSAEAAIPTGPQAPKAPQVPAVPAPTPLHEYIGTPDILPGR